MVMLCLIMANVAPTMCQALFYIYNMMNKVEVEDTMKIMNRRKIK